MQHYHLNTVISISLLRKSFYGFILTVEETTDDGRDKFIARKKRRIHHLNRNNTA